MPGEQLIGSPVDGHAAGGVRLPPGNADRQQRRAGSDACQPDGASRPDDEPSHLGAVTLRAAGGGGILARARIATRIEHVEPGQQRPPDVGMDEVDTGVEQGDRDARAGKSRNPDIRPTPSGDVEDVVDTARVDRSRDGSAHRENAEDVRIARDDREATGVERGGEAVEHAVVGVLGLDRGAAECEPRDHGLLGGTYSGRPGTFLLLGRNTARRGHPCGERGLVEHDDPAPAELSRRPVAEQALPANRGCRLIGRAARPTAQEQGCADEDRRAEQAGSASFRQPTHTHPG